MPKPIGTDRVRPGPGGDILLDCRRPKGWTARRERTALSVEHPGTAVEWEGALFEVTSAEARPGGAVRYTLAPWRDSHVIRLADRYDEASESARASRDRAQENTRARRQRANLLAPLTGHLPRAVQERMRTELGISPGAHSLISLVLPFAFGLICLRWVLFREAQGVPAPVPPIVTSIGLLLLAESVLRLIIIVGRGRPCGSTLGTFAYTLRYLLARDRSGLVSPFGDPEGSLKTTGTPAPASVEITDRYRMLEPFLALLSPREQEVLRRRFGFDPERWGRRTAVVLLILAVGGLVSDLAGMAVGRAGLATAASLLVALGLLLEQILRLATLSRGPAGSILGHIVRPFARSLLEGR